jgi:hypothetical protein
MDNRTLEEQQKLLDLLSGAYEDEAKNVQKLLSLQNRLNDARSLGLDTVTDLEAEVSNLTKGLGAEEKQILQLKDSIEQTTKNTAELDKGMGKLKESMASVGIGLSGLVSSMDQIAGTSFANLGNGIGGLITEVGKYNAVINKLEVDLRRSTGFQNRYTNSFHALRKEYKDMNLPQEVLAGNLKALNANFKAFDGVSKEQRKNVTLLAGEFYKLGASQEDTAKLADVLKSALGYGGSGLTRAMKDNVALSAKLGMNVGEVMKNFVALTPQLAKFGTAMPRVFDKLQKQARSLAMDVKDIFNVADSFDTFEGSMELAGKLNSQFGMELNAIQMMRMEEGERNELLREKFFETGRDFDSMQKRQKQMMASFLFQGDVDKTRRFFQQGMDISSFSEGEPAKRDGEAFSDLSEKMQVTAETQMDAVLDTLGGYNKTLEKQVQALEFVQRNSQTLATALIGKSTMSSLTGAGLALGTAGVTTVGGYKLLKNKGVGELVKTAAKGGGKLGVAAKLLMALGVGGAAVAPKLASETVKQGVKYSMGNVGKMAAQKTGEQTAIGLAKGLTGTTAKNLTRGVPVLGSLIGIGINKASGDTWGRSVVTGVAGAVSGALATAGLGLATSGVGLLAGGAAYMGGAVAGEYAAGKAFDAIFGGPAAAPGTPGSVPSAQTSAASQAATGQAAQAGFVAEEVVMPITLNIDGNEFVTAVGTANNVLFKQKQR